jgi:IS5 family transposase
VSKSRNKSGVRAKVEHGFGVIKQVFGFVKVRYRGRQRTPNIRW